ncbi:UNVERIFIED_CONTAM: hypothetical protein FKN15_004105 [Acipenser sinensis]
MNTRCPPKHVPSAACFFILCRLTMQPPQSYSVGGQRSSGQLTGKPAGARPDYRGRWCAVSRGHPGRPNPPSPRRALGQLSAAPWELLSTVGCGIAWTRTGDIQAIDRILHSSEFFYWMHHSGAPVGYSFNTGSAHRYHPCADSGGAKMNTRCPPKRVPSAARFFTLCRLTVQPPQSYSVGGQCSSGQLTGKPAGARPDYRGRWCAVSRGHPGRPNPPSPRATLGQLSTSPWELPSTAGCGIAWIRTRDVQAIKRILHSSECFY